MAMALTLCSAAASLLSQSLPTASPSRYSARGAILCKEGFFDSVSPAKYEPRPFGAADTDRNPRDTIPLDQLDDFAARMSASIAEDLDREWIEQEDHKLVAKEAARLHIESRNNPDESDEIGQILAYIGYGLEKWDVYRTECFVNAWEVANMASSFIMNENYPDGEGFGFNRNSE